MFPFLSVLLEETMLEKVGMFIGVLLSWNSNLSETTDKETLLYG